jgi:hypothetical protein
MQGIEFLTSTQVATEWAFNWTVFWWVLGVIFGVCLIISIYYVVSDQCEWGIIPLLSFLGIMIGSLVGILFGKSDAEPIAYETHYKVTISEEVSLKDFYECYDVVEQDGKIFTIREKDNNE